MSAGKRTFSFLAELLFFLFSVSWILFSVIFVVSFFLFIVGSEQNVCKEVLTHASIP